jgi:hypothetical protein
MSVSHRACHRKADPCCGEMNAGYGTIPHRRIHCPAPARKAGVHWRPALDPASPPTGLAEIARDVVRLVRRAERHGKRHQWGEALEALSTARRLLGECEEEVVDGARADDWTWEEIGRHLGVTGSAVAQRHANRARRRRHPEG